MSLLEAVVGGFMQGAGKSMVEEDQRKKDYIDEKRRLAENERLYRRNRKDTIADENRRLGREVREQYPDLATGEMVTVYQDGRVERTKLRPDQLKAIQQQDERTSLVNEQMRAQIEAMRRGGSGGSGGAGGQPVTVTSGSLLASMGFEDKNALYDSGDDKAITAYESMLGVRLAPEELVDLRSRLQNIARTRRQADTILNAEQAAVDAGGQAPLYFYTGNDRQITPAELARQAQLRRRQEELRRSER